MKRMALFSLVWPIIAMAVVVITSNIVVEIQINDWLTWGALTYPVAFLVTDVTNRLYGPAAARRAVLVGFACAVVGSLILANPRIALASGTAFLVAQLLDVGVFDRLRGLVWFLPPLVSSFLASAVDTALFFSLAFAEIGALGLPATGVPWVTLAIGDMGVKVAMALLLLLPYRGATARMERGQPA